MLGKKIGVFLVVTCLLSPAIVFGQEMMGGKWWQSKRIAEELEITKEEKRQLDEIYTASRRELITLKSNVERERFELDNLLDHESAKKKDIKNQFNKLENARSTLSEERFNLLLGVRDIVGIERYQQLKILHRMKRDKKTKWHKDKKRDRDD
jgi:Spy/CpxP family protein refolding chaperone